MDNILLPSVGYPRFPRIPNEPKIKMRNFFLNFERGFFMPLIKLHSLCVSTTHNDG